MVHTMDIQTAEQISESAVRLAEALFRAAITDCDHNNVRTIRKNIRQARNLLEDLNEYAESYLDDEDQKHFFGAK